MGGGSLLEQLEEDHPDQIENTEEYRADYDDTDMNLDTEDAGMWLLSQDLLEILGYSIGSFLFLIIDALVLYF